MQTNPRLNIRPSPGPTLLAPTCAGPSRPNWTPALARRTTNPGPRRRALTAPCSLWRTTKAPASPWAAADCRLLDDTTAEIKRLYVLPYTRGSGVASSILAALEAEAYKQGITRIKAEAGSAQPDGRNFYENSGFEPVPNFGPYIGVEHSYCYAKPIDSHSAAHTAMA